MSLVWTQGQTPLTLVVTLLFMGYRKSALVVFIALYFFFRAPIRQPKKSVTEFSSPADGTVIDIEYGREFNRVAIYLSLRDVHVQYAPSDCTVVSQSYHEGTFSPALWKEKSNYNERLDTVLETLFGPVLVRQIAGTIARTIVSFCKEGDKLVGGQHLGMIKFGSRVDVIVPKHLQPVVKVGQKVSACSTVLFIKKE